jgi:peptide chain release factor 2
LNVDAKISRSDALSRQMSEADFWNDAERSTKVVQELKNLKNNIEPFEKLARKHKELSELIAIAKEEDKDFIRERVSLYRRDIENYITKDKKVFNQP